MMKKMFCKRKNGKKESLLPEADPAFAKKQRNKRWLCGGPPVFMPEFFGVIYESFKNGGPNLTFALAHCFTKQLSLSLLFDVLYLTPTHRG
jgi:hypothetical protein